MYARKPKRDSSGGRAGFSLVEALIAVLLLAVGTVPLIWGLRLHTEFNYHGSNMSRATALAQEIREWTLNLPFTDPDEGDGGKPPGADGSSPATYVDDLDDLYVEGGLTYSPPVCTPDSANPTAVNPLSGLENWSQVITLTWRDPTNPNLEVAAGSSELIHVHVDILFYDKVYLSTGWLISNYHEED